MKYVPLGSLRTPAMPGRSVAAVATTSCSAPEVAPPSVEVTLAITWLEPARVSSEKKQSRSPRASTENSGSHRPSLLGVLADPDAQLDRYDQVAPWSPLFHTRIAGTRPAALFFMPTAVANSSVPAGSAPSCRGSSNSVPQHDPRPSLASGSWISLSR